MTRGALQDESGVKRIFVISLFPADIHDKIRGKQNRINILYKKELFIRSGNEILIIFNSEYC